jgi:hypothetical protein
MKRTYYNQILIFIIILILGINYIFINCNSVEPPTGLTINLKLEDVSYTEAWIELTTTNMQLPTNISLKQINPTGDTTSHILNLNTKDSLLYIDSLLPNQTYKLKSSSILHPVSSNEISVTTLDTTSHNFTWETFTFGEHSSSIFYDVAIVGEEIWAVGEIYLNDSLGQPDLTPYNAIHWDGSNWSIIRIPTRTFSGTLVSSRISTILAFNENDFWTFSIAGSYSHWNGNTWETEYIKERDGSGNMLWGTNSSNLYLVCTNGGITNYNGQSWQKLVSGTTVGLSDIYGNENGEIYACGGNLSTGQGIVLKINSNNTVSKIIDSYYYGSGFDSSKMFTENLYGPLSGIWVNSNGTVYTVGNLIYRYNLGLWNYEKGIEYNYLGAGEFTGRGFSWDVSGIGNNDFIFVGERNTVRYFNGIRAIQIGEPFSYTSEYQWYSVDYKQNIAIAAGKKGGQAAVIVFKR